ncbi:MAG: hypothetical protein Q4D79_01810 [Propionibacteriaceae bacterium]|nr:hypothetical protein [Propionibacteriaceae bacterium]
MKEIILDQGPVLVGPPEGFWPMGSDEPETWAYSRGQVLAEVRLSCGGRPALEFVLHNLGDGDVTVPGFHLGVPAPARAWLAGAEGRLFSAGGVWVQVSGWCADGGGDAVARTALVFGAEVRLAPGQRVWARWRWVPADQTPELPRWVPTERYLPAGEKLLIPDLDVALTGQGLGFETVEEGTLVRGSVGQHQLQVYGPTGRSVLEIGWYYPLPWLVPTALARVGDRADLEAWFLTRLFAQPGLGSLEPGEVPTAGGNAGPPAAQVEQLLDRLDVALGRCFEHPTLWGVLAGLYAARSTELPVRDDAVAAAARLIEADPDSDHVAFLAAEAMLAGELELASGLLSPPRQARGEAWDLLTIDDETAAQSIRARLEGGEPTSGPISYTAKDVALAQLWLATRPDSVTHLSLTPVVQAAQRRLLSGLSAEPQAVPLAWLLTGRSLAPGAV